MVLTPYLPTSNVFFRSFTSTHTITPGPEPQPPLPSAEKKTEPTPAPVEPVKADETAETGIGGAWLKCIPVLGGAFNVAHGLVNFGQAINAARKHEWEVARPRAIQGTVRLMAGSFNIVVYGCMLPIHAIHHPTTEYLIPSWGATLTSERQLAKLDRQIDRIEQLDSEGRQDEARAVAHQAEKEVLGSLADDLPGVGQTLQAGKAVSQSAKLFARFRPGKGHGLVAAGREVGQEIHN